MLKIIKFIMDTITGMERVKRPAAWEQIRFLKEMTVEEDPMLKSAREAYERWIMERQGK